MPNEERIAKLPEWVQKHIQALTTAHGPYMEEIAQLRKRVAELERIGRSKQDRIDAMVEMFRCAAKGGNEIALAVKSIVENFLTHED